MEGTIDGSHQELEEESLLEPALLDGDKEG
jgi:hypothetical protein